MASIYLAGKISKNDWRHDVVKGLHGRWGSDGDWPGDWPIIKNGVLDTFDYVGPYFMACDHGCAHGANSHGCGPDDEIYWDDPHLGGIQGFARRIEGGAYPAPDRKTIMWLCLDAINRADIFFAWLDDKTAYGTLVELGYAFAHKNKKIYIAAPEAPMMGGPDDLSGGHDPLGDLFAQRGPNSSTMDLWFAFTMGEHIIEATPELALEQLLVEHPQFDSPLEEAFWQHYLNIKPTPLKGLVPQHVVLNGKYRLDFALPNRKIGIELDGYTYHSSKDAFNRDRVRQRELEMAQWRIIRFTGDEVRANVRVCVDQAAQFAASLNGGAT